MLSKFAIYSALAAIVIGALSLAIIVPPFDKPDEDLHFYKAVAVSQGNLICPQQNGRLQNMVPKAVYLFVETSIAKLNLGPTLTNIPTQAQISETRSCVLPFIFYLIPGLIQASLIPLNISIPTLFYMGRVVNALLALFILIISLRSLPPKLKLISIYVFGLPMTMFQISSFSKDVYYLAAGIYVFNRLLAAWIKREVSRVELGCLGLAMTLLVLARPQFFWFILLFMTLPLGQKIKSKLKFGYHPNFLISGVILIICSVAISLFIARNVYLSPYNPNTALSYYQEIDPTQQLRFVLLHPFKFGQAIFNSGLTYLGFYLKGMIGILGQLDKPLPDLVYVLYVALGSGITAVIASTPEIKVIKKYWKLLLVIMILTLLNLFTAMYLYGTPVGAPIVLGLQGRYFINLIPLVMLLAGLGISIFWKKVSILNKKI